MIKVVRNNNIVNEYGRARTRLILLDYDGTLVPFDQDYKLTNPDQEIVSLLQSLAADSKNTVLLVSGRDKEYLETQFNGMPITLVAEHGGYHKKGDGNWNSMLVGSMGWMPNVLAALHTLVARHAGSFVEQKAFSLAWHYRKIAERITELDKRQIVAALKALPEHEHFTICDSEFTMELRTPGIDKGEFISRWVGERYFDFTMLIGDSRTDEDAFKVLGDDAYSIKVGESAGSSANFYLESQKEVLPFLLTLLEGNNSLSHGNESRSSDRTS